MIFTPDYSMKYSMGNTLMTALVGIITVVCVLMIIALLINIVSKCIQAMEKGKKSDAPTATVVEVAPAASGTPLPESESQGELTLIETDEKTAAIIMAIVSDMSGIPLNRLCFKSIKLLEDETK